MNGRASPKVSPHASRSRLTLLVAGLLLAAPAAFAADDAKWLKQIERFETRLQGDRLKAQTLPETVEIVAEIHSDASECIRDAEADLAKIDGDLAAVGDAVLGEPREVQQGRAALEKQRSTVESTLAGCRLAQLRSTDLLDELNRRQQRDLKRQLLARGPSVDELVAEQVADPGNVWRELRDFVTSHSGIDRLPHGWITVLVTALPGLLIGIGCGVALRRWSMRIDASRSLGAGFGRALLAASGYYLPHVLATLGVALGAWWLIETDPLNTFVLQLAAGLAGYFLVSLVLATLLLPRAPAQAYLPMDPTLQRALGRRLEVLALLALIGVLLFFTTLDQTLSEATTLSARAIFAPFVALNVIWITWLISRIVKGRLRWIAGPLLAVFVLAFLGAEWLGFRTLSVFFIRGLLLTLLALGVVWLANWFLRDLYDGLDRGIDPWQQWLRQRMRLHPGELMPGVFWLRSITGLVLWGSFVLFELRIWGMSESGFVSLFSWFTDGFRIGDFVIVPEKLVYAVLTLSAILLFSGWFKRQLGQNWLLKSRMNRGAREAVVTTAGYTGVAVAILSMLSVVGVEFANVALIAGALSVGIGFGLQNIVNNFVSGLILLMERPIRTGDWVVVGSTEGYVRRISIRSTLIETFDRADVIVPNSELISGQVTNWMLRDAYGRARIPIGVAYGSDTERVRELLLEIAKNHPDVASDVPGVSDPHVFFMGFGDSSLDLELRVFIRQVDSRLRVISDLNFAIDAAFRAESIEIPFPQRDVHLIKPPPSQEQS